MRRPELTIDKQALLHNHQVARFHAGSQRLFAAVKADGYGHGLLRVAALLQHHTDGFAVATVGEAEALRSAGVALPILVIQGPMDQDELHLAQDLQLELVFHDHSQIALAERTSNLRGRLRVWLKANTGMNRLGLATTEITAARQRLLRCGFIHPAVGLMTHFASADEPGARLTTKQLDAFNAISPAFPQRQSLCNSAALLDGINTGNWMRPGIMLYGGNPFITGTVADWGLKPVMRLTTRLIAKHRVGAGETIGYGGRYRALHEMVIGVAAIGYGDGYPRHARDGTPIAVDGQQTELVGRVSMDLITIDLTRVQAQVGSVVECWGPSVDINEVARHADTISYELMCKLSHPLRQTATVV